MRATLLTAAALAALLAGCKQKQASGAIPRQRFVLANVDLRSVPDTAPKGDSLRKAALKKHRVSEADLRRFVDVHGRSPEYLAGVWREVSDSVQKRYERSFPARVQGGPPPGVGIPGTSVPPTTSVPPATLGRPPQALPAVVREANGRKPPPPPDVPPPPVTEVPRPMVRGQLPPPPRRPPANPPADARTPMTRPGQRPLVVPPDSSTRPR